MTGGFWRVALVIAILTFGAGRSRMTRAWRYSANGTLPTRQVLKASHGVLMALQEMNRIDGAAIVENAMKAADGVVEDEEFEYARPPAIFLSYQWGMQDEVKLLQRHLNMAGYECWMDIGQMGGGDKLFAKIDNGIRAAKVVICCVTEKYAHSPNCNREVNLSVNLGKPIIPLLMEKMNWPPKGSMGPVFSEYLFIRFFQRGDEETSDQRYWSVPKFQELLLQLNFYAVPDDKLIKKAYKDWWKPMVEEIVIDKKKTKTKPSKVNATTEGLEGKAQPVVFLSYQWGKQPQIKNLYQRLTSMGYTVWMDIYQMGGGDSLYDKIYRGLRGCTAVVSCVTTKYTLSSNCRREVSLADALKKPIIPLLLEQMKWPPDGPMSMIFTELLYINCYRDTDVQMSWMGPPFNELTAKLQEQVPSVGDSNAETNSKKSISGSTAGTAKPKPVAGNTPSTTKKNVNAVASTPKSNANTTPRINRNTVTNTLPASNTEHDRRVDETRPKYNAKTTQATTRSVSKVPEAKGMTTGSTETSNKSILPTNAETTQMKAVTRHTHMETNTKDSVSVTPNNKTISQAKPTAASKSPSNRQHPSNTGLQPKNVTTAKPTGKSETQSTSKACVLM